MRALSLLSVLSAALVLAGCASPPVQYYVLTPATQTPAPVNAQAPSIAVGPVNVPELIDQPRIVLQLAGNQVSLQEYQRWGSPVKAEVGRVIAANLQAALGASRVWTFQQAVLPEPEVQVLADVRRFESRLGEGVVIEVLWGIQRKGAAVRTGQTLATEATDGADYNQLAAAHSRALAKVSREIATAIRAP